MKLQEIKEMSDKDLKERLDAEKLSLNQLVISHSITPLDNPSILKEKRKDIARINTEIRAREINKA
ncbi:MAG: 50S ribosomal protein L29 [Dysgonamonadaceae bacterium]|nr:50S ribosomal protein L29 [Dysgonamonadaceae bacterium]MDD4727639.1 50S ribosomal protein L29 [Dysgonamonadaceae bacterium]